MKRIIILALVLTVPVFLSLKVWQVRRYQSLERETRELEQVQRDWLERNKKFLASIAVFRSPARVERLARDRLGLTNDDKEPGLRIEFMEQGE